MWAILIGLISFIFVILTVGSISALFLYLLEFASNHFATHEYFIFILPILGLVTGWTYWRFGKTLPTTRSILNDVNSPRVLIPFLTGVLIFVFTILSQLFGASTGRESTAVQFGAAFAELWKDLFSKKFRVLYFHREAYIRCGIAAGFGAVFGVPWAGCIFGIESTPSRRWTFRYLPLCWISSFGAHWMALWCGAHHKVYPVLTPLPLDFVLIAKWSCLGVLFGITARAFIFLLSLVEKRIFARIHWPWLRPFVGGVLIVLLTLLLSENRYSGLGVNLIDAAMTGHVQNFDFALKSVFTIISSGSDFKGGEVTPLMAIGATLGVLLSNLIMLPAVYVASLGLVSVFASASHIPWTGSIMAWELFGFEAFLPTFIICWFARRILGIHGLFTANH